MQLQLVLGPTVIAADMVHNVYHFKRNKSAPFAQFALFKNLSMEIGESQSLALPIMHISSLTSI